MVLPTVAAVRQSCSVVLSWYGTISYTWYEVHQTGHKYKERLSNNMIIQTILKIYAMALDTGQEQQQQREVAHIGG